MKHLYCTDFCFQQFHFIIFGTSKGICYIKVADEPKDNWVSFKRKFFMKHTLMCDNDLYMREKEVMRRYLEGRTDKLLLETDPYGTDFQRMVWEQLRSIPFGQITTYQTIAQQLNRPTAIRAVANAIGANPLLLVNPCHRVIGKNGKLTGFRAGLPLKKTLLQLEQKIVYK